MEVMVTQGDVMYISEVEKLCSNLSLNDCLLGLTSLDEDSIEVVGGSGTVPQLQLTNPNATEQARTTSHNSPTSGSPGRKFRRNYLIDGVLPPVPTKLIEKEATVDSTKLNNNDIINDPFFDPLLRPPPASVAPWSHSLLILIPLRLGIQTINKEYIEVSN